MMFIGLCFSSLLQTQLFERGPGQSKCKCSFVFIPDEVEMDSQRLEALVPSGKEAGLSQQEMENCCGVNGTNKLV